MAVFRVIVAGTRAFNNYVLLKDKLNKLLKNKDEIIIISGTCEGADLLGERYAKERGYKIEQYPPHWDIFGKRAGYLRNKEMAEVADACVVFWDGKSKGTKLMIDLAKQYNIILRVIQY